MVDGLFVRDAGLAKLLQFAEIDHTVLTGEREIVSAAALLRDAADPVIASVVGRQRAVVLDQKSAFIRKERVTQVILRTDCRWIAKIG